MGSLWSVILLGGPGQLWLLPLTILPLGLTSNGGWPLPSMQLDRTIRGCWGVQLACIWSPANRSASVMLRSPGGGIWNC